MTRLLKFSGLFILVLLGMVHAACHVAEASNETKDKADSYALVIGVENYQHLPSYPHALDNAGRVALMLKFRNYKVTLLQDPSAVALKAALDKLVNQHGQTRARRIVVYFCGQAKSQILPDGTQLGWILPIDHPGFENQSQEISHGAISTRMITTFAKQVRSRHMIMLFDAAFAADFFNPMTPSISSFNPETPRSVRQYIVAGSAGQSIPENRMFSDLLFQGLNGEANIFWDDYVTGTELAVYLSDRVAQATNGNLKLQYGTTKATDSPQGDFFFHQAEAALPGTLFVDSHPETARIKILNIKPAFRQGMLLSPGGYRLQVSEEGFVTQERKIVIKAGQTIRLKFELDQSKSLTVNSLGMKFKWIRNGRYRMGSPVDERGRQLDEQHHWVTFSDGFWIQTKEVTVGQFKSFISQTGYVTDAQKNGGCWINQPSGRWQRRPDVYWQTAGQWMQANPEAQDEFPATCISWNDAAAFARWLSDREGRLYRLPTEQQWEAACRAGSSAPFSFGQCLNISNANFATQVPFYGACQSISPQLSPTLQKTGERYENRWGLSDMHGNAAEWCLDKYGPYGQVSPELAQQDLLRNTERIIRGGHFASPAAQCRSASRSSFKPNAAANVIGFRLTQMP